MFVYATVPPSGEYLGAVSNRFAPVRGRLSPDSTSRSLTVDESPCPVSVSGRCTYAREEPSGDQETGDGGGPGGSTKSTLHSPDVSRRASPPSAETSHR